MKTIMRVAPGVYHTPDRRYVIEQTGSHRWEAWKVLKSGCISSCSDFQARTLTECVEWLP